jgi:hypothetical protein
MQTPWWWQDGIVLSQLQVVLSILGVFVGVILGILAFRLAKRQVDIAGRQTDMQEEQHTFFKEQREKKPDLRIIVDGTDLKFVSQVGQQFQATSTIRFSVHNGGNKSAEPFYWELLIPEELSPQVRFVNENGEQHDGELSHRSRDGTLPKDRWSLYAQAAGVLAGQNSEGHEPCAK